MPYVTYSRFEGRKFRNFLRQAKASSPTPIDRLAVQSPAAVSAGYGANKKRTRIVRGRLYRILIRDAKSGV